MLKGTGWTISETEDGRGSIDPGEIEDCSCAGRSDVATAGSEGAEVL